MISPFKFLDAYTREDRAIFFGRDREIEELYQKVFSSKILLIYGISGTGKTSLINCGLANKFEDSDWLPVNVRRGGDIISSLWRELEKVALTVPTLTTDKEGEVKKKFVKFLHSVYLDHFKPIYLIFDQFEELFIFGSRGERDEFIKVVKEVVDSDVQCRFIFSIREEYLAGVTEFETTIPDFLSNRLRIEKMTHQHAIEAIEGPCRVHGIGVEEGFSYALLDKLDPESKEVELTYLQVFLDKLYRLIPTSGDDRPVTPPQVGFKEDTSASTTPSTQPPSSDSLLTTHYSLSLSLLQRAGDVTDLLGSFLEQQVAELEDPETGLVVLKAFVSVQGTKRQVTGDEVAEFSKTLGKPVTGGNLTELIQRFVNLRILRDKDENGRYELRHDSLAAKIYEKITLVEKELIEVRQFIENALQAYEKRRILLSDKDLKYLQVYEDRLYLEGQMKEFVEQSKKTIHAKRRQFNNILRVSMAGFILLVAGMGYYYYQTTSETKNVERATKSLLQSKIAPGLSYRTGVEAYGLDSTSSIAHFAILNAFYEMLDKGQYYDSVKGNWYDPKKLIFDFKPCQTDIISAKFSQDGQLIYGWLADNTIKIWDVRGKELICTGEKGHQIIAHTMSDNNEYLAVVYKNSTGIVWNINGERVFDFPVVTNPVWNRKVVAFSPDNRFLVTAGSGNDIIIYELNGQEYQRLEGHSNSINYVSFSPDARLIASASDDSTIIIWNYNRNTKLFGPYGTILHHQAEARSCNFSKNSKYILTASDDSTFAIWNLNGEQVYYFSPEGQYRYKGITIDKICDADFSGDEKLVKITAYHPIEKDTSLNNDSMIFNDYKYAQRLMTVDEYYIEYLSPYKNKFVREDFNFDLLAREEYDFYVREVGDIDYNAKDQTIACEISGSRRTSLMSNDLLPLRYFTGTNPVCSPDGNYLLCISNNELYLYPVSVSEIMRLVDEEQIFGELNFNKGDWINIF